MTCEREANGAKRLAMRTNLVQGRRLERNLLHARRCIAESVVLLPSCHGQAKKTRAEDEQLVATKSQNA